MILLGSTFPLSLIRRRVVITPEPIENLRAKLATEGYVSFWGHENTRGAAAAILGVDPWPSQARPALSIDDNALPMLEGQTFREVWILSPDFVPGFRPGIGEEVQAEEILGWHTLRLLFDANWNSDPPEA